jgi:RNA polymerase sigma-70 factor (ECF subfamily)
VTEQNGVDEKDLGRVIGLLASSVCRRKTIVCICASARPPSGQQTDARKAMFETWYQRHSQVVRTQVYGLCLDAEITLDITQEAFLRLWRQIQNAKVIRQPRSWLVRVARNLMLDLMRSSFHRHGTAPRQRLEAVCVDTTLPLESLECEEAFCQVRAALEELPVADREILTLRYNLEYTPGQIAGLLGLTLPATRLRLCRARRRLAKRLAAAETSLKRRATADR